MAFLNTMWRIRLVLLLLSVTALSFILTSTYLTDKHRELQFGDAIRVRLPRSLHTATAPWIVVLYVKPYARNGDKNARYMQRLAQRSYNSPTVFMIVTAGFGKGQDPSQFLGLRKSRAVLINASEVPSLANSFFQSTTGVMLVDPSGRIRFVTYDFVEPDDIKLIVGKYLTDTIPYTTASNRTLLRPGAPWTPFHAVDLVTNAPSTINPASQVYITFTARCTECTLPGYISALRSVLERLHPKTPPILLFSSTFDSRLIKSLCHGIRAPMYAATESIPGIEDPDTLDIYAPSEVMVIRCISGKVSTVESWDAFAKKVATF